jgi:uncharacterized protein (DUF305 family)
LILKKSDISPRVRRFASNIVNTQTKEITEMKQMIQQEEKHIQK